MTTLLLLAALGPPFFLFRYIYRLDSVEKEPGSLLARLFILGIISVIPAMFLETALTSWIEGTAWSMLSLQILDNFIGVALVEEGCKYFFLKRATWKHEAFNYRFDAVVYAAVVSLGFAAAENVLYTFEYGMSIALIRAVTSIPGHAIFGIYMGYYYGMAKYAAMRGEDGRSRSYRAAALLVPLLLHGFYDFMLSFNEGSMTLLFIGYLVILDIFALRSLKRNAREDEPV